MRTHTLAAWRAALPLTLCAAFGCGESDTVIPPEPDWYLVWNDEFDGAAGDKVDESKWAYDTGTGDNGWGNAEHQFYTNRASNVALDGESRLAIVARREAFGGSPFTSARIKTQGKFTQQYGRIEARLQLPQGQGVWPAFWMLGDDIGEVGWPQTGEIDIMEFRGQEPSVVHGTLHGPGYFGGDPITRLFRLPDDETFVEDFHVFAVDWDPTRIAWSVDGEVYQVVTDAQVRGRGQWVFDHPFFVILNVAVGGNFVGNPSPDTPLPQSMLVDYVRVYSRTPPAGE